MVAQERHVLRDAVVERLVVFRGVARDRLLHRQLRVADLFHREQRARPPELALHERDFLGVRVRDELDVLEIPVVVLDADARRPGLLRQFRLDPGREVVRRLLRFGGVGCEVRRLPLQFLRERVENAALLADRLRAMEPEVPAVARQVRLRLREQRGNRAEAGADLRRVIGRERKLVAPQLDRALGERPLARRLIGLLVEHRDVEGRIVRPGLEHSVVEVEPVELGADEMPVHLLRNRPGARVHLREALAELGNSRGLRRHRRRRVVRDAVGDFRLLKGAEVLEERDEVAGRAARRRRRSRCPSRHHSREETHRHQERRCLQ